MRTKGAMRSKRGSFLAADALLCPCNLPIPVAVWTAPEDTVGPTSSTLCFSGALGSFKGEPASKTGWSGETAKISGLKAVV